MKPADRDPHPFDWPAQAGAVDDVLREMDLRVAARRRQRRRTRLALGAVASFLAVVAVTQFLPHATPPRTEVAQTPASAIVSLPPRQTLPDGSIVELKGDARIRVDFSDSVRRVHLVSGEAHFKVEKNPQRPFIVSAGSVEFRAVGTAFAVQLGQAEVELVVTEGQVAVDQTPAPAAPAIALHAPQTLALVQAGKRLLVPAATKSQPLAARVEALAAPQLKERMAWRVPRLEFSATPLGDALTLFNQHSATRIQLADPALASLRVSGILRADNVETLLVLLEESHGIRVEKRTEQEIVLRRK